MLPAGTPVRRINDDQVFQEADRADAVQILQSLKKSRELGDNLVLVVLDRLVRMVRTDAIQPIRKGGGR